MLSRTWRHACRRYSQAVNFRTTETLPSRQNEKQIGLFYTLDKNVCKHLYAHGGLPKSFSKQAKTFAETSIMIRKPALQLIKCIQSSDMDKPVIRYVLYGEKGAGKSLTMAHMLHYAQEQGYLIVHIPWVSEWLRRITRHKEMSNSLSHEGFVDLPLDAAAWLLHFKTQNQELLKNTNLSISNEYVWSKREKTEVGAPLLELVDHGINRVKYASDVIDVLMREIKQLSNEKKCKTFVAIDGFNCFFCPTTRLSIPGKKHVKPTEVTLTAPFMEITKNDWRNGVILLTVDPLAMADDHQESYNPKYLLMKEGFEHLDPFVPIKVDRYSDKEFVSCANYYRDRLWLRGPAEVDDELRSASAQNPYYFMTMCAPL